MNNNPLLDTRSYKVDFSDVRTEVLTANNIAENLLAQVYEEGHRQMLLDEIIYHRQDVNAIGKEDAFMKTPKRTKKRKITTTGWQLLIQWKDRYNYWVVLKDIKRSYPFELADY